MSLTIFYNEKTPFYALKTRRSKRRKIDIFPKGLTHGFGPKMVLFSTSFFLGNIGQEHVFYDILERKNAFLGYKKQKFEKSKNCHFFKGVNPWFLYKNGHFSIFFLLGNIGQEKVFVFDILERKNAFLGYKKRSSKRRKTAIFPKGLTHVFGLKMIIFPTSLFQEKQAIKVLFTIFQNKKNAFLGYKNKKFKKSKNCHFSKGVNPQFLRKLAIFATSFFQAKWATKMSFTIFQNEKTPVQAIKTRSSKSQKIAIFLKGLTNCFGRKWPFIQLLFWGAIQARKMCFTIFQNKKTPFQAIKKEDQKLEKLRLF